MACLQAGAHVAAQQVTLSGTEMSLQKVFRSIKNKRDSLSFSMSAGLIRPTT
ncbi:hypothetical protein [Paraflavitalea speifideaquila]|uniref:hypothetical protein n=1 Tax=Paraflavitalea speifideaquila TaxID=3076558 RepID=UPI0028E34A5C|nr:hypothetical protein [Paraflavitalea speifideiaquila]